MLLSRVKGHVVSTAKVDELVGKKLLLVEIVTVREHGLESTGRHMVCIDAVGAGEGELVLVVMGSSARIAAAMKDVPTDAVIVGIIDSLQALGRDLQLSQ
ncbi:MAG: ethanolamine utilization protein EutN [Candidatus Latescibacteria bacterium]|nr:ethanolamine utilization protein EutN [Candidatus Latescibacterota bacterium]